MGGWMNEWMDRQMDEWMDYEKQWINKSQIVKTQEERAALSGSHFSYAEACFFTKIIQIACWYTLCEQDSGKVLSEYNSWTFYRLLWLCKSNTSPETTLYPLLLRQAYHLSKGASFELITLASLFPVLWCPFKFNMRYQPLISLVCMWPRVHHHSEGLEVLLKHWFLSSTLGNSGLKSLGVRLKFLLFIC